MRQESQQDLYRVAPEGRTRITLGPGWGRGGEAEVCPVNDLDGCVAKIYHKGNGASHASREKLEAMLSKKPERLTNRARDSELPQFAWPTHIVEDAGRTFRGFVMRGMPRQDTELLTSYMSRLQQKRLSEDDRSLPRRVLVCANLAAAMAEMHRLKHFVVDVKPENIAMFKETGLLCLLDNDSFSIAGERRRFPATALTSGYIAPEVLANRLLPAAVITDWHDRFALAVLIFQVLNNGVHPFQGVPLFDTDEWSFDLCVEQGLYPYGVAPHPRVQPCVSSVHATWPASLREMFDRAFTSAQGSKRPSAAEWRDALQAFQQKPGWFARCEARPHEVMHIHFSGMPCQQCLIEKISAQQAAERTRRREAAAESRARALAAVTGEASESAPAAGRAKTDWQHAATGRTEPASGRPASPQPQARAAMTRSEVGPSRTGRKAVYIVLALALLLLVLFLYAARQSASPTVGVPVPPTADAPPQATPAAAQAVIAPVVDAQAPAAAPAEPVPVPAPGAPMPAAPADPANRPAATVPDASSVEGRMSVLAQAISAAGEQNQEELGQILAAALAGDDEVARERATTLMRRTDFVRAFAAWEDRRKEGREINADVMQVYRKDLPQAIAQQWRALALAQEDREVASNLAWYLALDRRPAALPAAVYALSLPRPAHRTGTSTAWYALAMAYTTARRPRESEAALQVARSISPRLPDFCQSMLRQEREYGEELQAAVLAVFRTIQERGRSGETSCGYPPQWIR